MIIEVIDTAVHLRDTVDHLRDTADHLKRLSIRLRYCRPLQDTADHFCYDTADHLKYLIGEKKVGEK